MNDDQIEIGLSRSFVPLLVCNLVKIGLACLFVFACAFMFSLNIKTFLANIIFLVANVNVVKYFYRRNFFRLCITLSKYFIIY